MFRHVTYKQRWHIIFRTRAQTLGPCVGLFHWIWEMEMFWVRVFVCSHRKIYRFFIFLQSESLFFFCIERKLFSENFPQIIDCSSVGNTCSYICWEYMLMSMCDTKEYDVFVKNCKTSSWQLDKWSHIKICSLTHDIQDFQWFIHMINLHLWNQNIRFQWFRCFKFDILIKFDFEGDQSEKPFHSETTTTLSIKYRLETCVNDFK